MPFMRTLATCLVAVTIGETIAIPFIDSLHLHKPVDAPISPADTFHVVRHLLRRDNRIKTEVVTRYITRGTPEYTSYINAMSMEAQTTGALGAAAVSVSTSAARTSPKTVIDTTCTKSTAMPTKAYSSDPIYGDTTPSQSSHHKPPTYYNSTTGVGQHAVPTYAAPSPHSTGHTSHKTPVPSNTYAPPKYESTKLPPLGYGSSTARPSVSVPTISHGAGPQPTAGPPGPGSEEGTVVQPFGPPLKIEFGVPASGKSYYAYVQGTATDVNKMVFYDPHTQGWWSPTATGLQQPINYDVSFKVPEVSSIVLPGYVASTRIYFSEEPMWFGVNLGGDGSVGLVQPAANNPNDKNYNVNWGFMELSWVKTGDGPESADGDNSTDTSGIWANISAVDFVGEVPIGVAVKDAQTTSSALGLPHGIIETLCDKLSKPSLPKDQNWNKLCVQNQAGKTFRVMAANVETQGEMYKEYVSQVWQEYSTRPVEFCSANEHDTPEVRASKTWICQVTGSGSATDVMVCTHGSSPQTYGAAPGGDSDETPTFAMPNTNDILGCNTGPFGQGGRGGNYLSIVPRLCAAFHRSTLLLDGGEDQPGPSGMVPLWYTHTKATNHYSRIVHELEHENKGYAFAYDDVSPTNEEFSGTVSTSNPEKLQVFIGGYST